MLRRVLKSVKNKLSGHIEGEDHAALSVIEYINQAYLFYINEDFDEAIKACDQAIALDPEYAHAYHYRGLCLFKQGRFQDAEHNYCQAAQLDPFEPEYYRNLGDSLFSLNKFNLAFDAYTKAISLSKLSADAYANRGNCLLELGRLDEAVDDYNKVLALDSKHLRALCNRAFCLYTLGNPNEALASYNKAMELAPNYQGLSPSRDNCNAALAFLKLLSETDNVEERSNLIKNTKFPCEPLLKRAAKLNELIRNHGLNFESAQKYLELATNSRSWLLIGQSLIRQKNFNNDVTMHVASMLLGVSGISATKIVNVLIERTFKGSTHSLNKFKFGMFPSQTKLEKPTAAGERHKKIKIKYV